MEQNNEDVKIPFLKKYLICLKKGWSIIVIFTIIGLLLGLLISSLSYRKKYEEVNLCELNFRYTTEVNINYKDIISENNINRCKSITKSLETGSKVSTYQYVDIKDISIVDNDGYYTIYANADSFNVGADGAYSDVAAKGFLKHLALLVLITDEEIEEYNNSDTKGHIVFSNFDKPFYEDNSLVEKKLIINYSNPDAKRLNQKYKITYYSLWISISGTTLLLASLIFILFAIGKLNMNVKHEYDNEHIYRTPFHISLWKDSIKNLKDVKAICMMGLLLGFVMIAKLLPIPSGFGNLGISLGFIFLSVACMMYGPCPALLIGALSDIIGYFIKADGMFFIGYTIQSMLACLFYSLCFYKTHITYSKCLIARVLVNFICNVLVGGISWGIISGFSFDATVTYILTISLPKNLVYLLPQSLVIYIILKALVRPMSALGFVNSDIADNVSFF